MLRSLGALLLALGAGCVPDPDIKVPDFSVPRPPVDMASPPADLTAPADLSDLGAAAWQPERTGTMAFLRGAWAADGALSAAYIVGHGGTILRRTQGGDYVVEPSGTTENLYAVVGLPGGEAYAVGAAGVILHRQEGTWKREGMGLALTVGLFGVAAAGPDEVIAVGDAGTIVRRSGGTWQAETSGTRSDLRAVWMGSGEAVAVGAMATILRRQMGGWGADGASVQPADRQNLFAIASLDGVLFAAGEYGTVLRRQMDRWVAEPTVKPPMMMQPPHLYGLWAGGGEVVVVGSAGALQRRTAMGTWVEERSGTQVDLSAVTGAGGRALLAVGAMGTVLRRP
ncbi:MAG: hypothetical protein RMK29_00740 [Myxococcales bacterium]|nr:hypothetical protein [Myxococcota bacterium]MDW8280204.1 hypothetical protein [Myxococcales bacterium]